MRDGCRHKESRERQQGGRERERERKRETKTMYWEIRVKKGLQREMVSEGGRRKAEARRWSESRDRQKRNNSFSLTVSTEIHKRTAKYNSEIQHSEKLFCLYHGEEWIGENTDWRRLTLSRLHTEAHCFLVDTVN